MKLCILPLIGWILLSNSATTQEWAPIELAQFATIYFPITPERVDTLGEIVLSVTDSIAIYLANVTEFSNEKSIKLTIEELPEFYNGIINGTLEATDGHLMSQKDFEINGLKGVEIMYSADSNPQLPEIRYKRILFVNMYLFSYDFWTTEEFQELAMSSKDRFFDSISITFKNSKQFTTTQVEKKFQKGRIIGRAFGFLLTIGGIILFYRFLTRKMRTKS